MKSKIQRRCLQIKFGEGLFRPSRLGLKQNLIKLKASQEITNLDGNMKFHFFFVMRPHFQILSWQKVAEKIPQIWLLIDNRYFYNQISNNINFNFLDGTFVGLISFCLEELSQNMQKSDSVDFKKGSFFIPRIAFVLQKYGRCISVVQSLYFR